MAYTGAQQVQGSSWAAQHSRLAACLALLLLHSAHVHAHRANTIGVDPTASETDDELNPVGQLSVAAGTSTNGPANPTHVTSATMNQGSTKKASTLIGGSSGSSGTPALSSTLSGGSSSSSGTIGAAGTRAGTTGSGSAAKPAATSGGHRSAAGASAGGGGEVGGSFSGRKLLRSSVAGVAAA